MSEATVPITPTNLEALLYWGNINALDAAVDMLLQARGNPDFEQTFDGAIACVMALRDRMKADREAGVA